MLDLTDDLCQYFKHNFVLPSINECVKTKSRKSRPDISHYFTKKYFLNCFKIIMKHNKLKIRLPN